MIEIEDLKNGTFAIVENGDNLAFTDADSAERIKRALERESMTVVAFEATPDQDATIEDVLDLADIRFEATGGTRTDALVAVLEDWRKRVTAEETTDKRTKMHLLLDEDDFRDIGAAVERRKEWDCDPDSDSCELGGMLAEICRGWMERVEHDKQQQPRRTDNGDGTVTFHGVPVTVCADVLQGCEVVAVRPPKRGERYIDSYGNARACCGNQENRLRVIFGPQPQQPEQAFREGCTYRDGKGNLCGPLAPSGDSEYPLKDQRGDVYTTDGKCRLARPDAMANLVPGEVIVWRHPGLRAGEYTWSKDGVLRGGGFIVVHGSTKCYLSSWTDPPRAGRWKVVDGQEYATWEGE